VHAAAGEVGHIASDEHKPINEGGCRQSQVPSVLALSTEQTRPFGDSRGIDRQDSIAICFFQGADRGEQSLGSVWIASFQRFRAASLFKQCCSTEAKRIVVDGRNPAADIGVAATVQFAQHVFRRAGTTSRDLARVRFGRSIALVEDAELGHMGQGAFEAEGGVRTTALGIGLGVFDRGFDLLTLQ